MKKLAIFVGAVVLTAASGIAASVGGCGSDDAAPPPLTDNGQTPIPNGGSDAAANNNNNNNNNPQDSGTNNNPTDDGGQTNTGGSAGKIACGGAECNTSTEACCIAPFSLDGGDTASCKAKADMCLGSKSVCDEAADCANGDVCCRAATGGTSCEKKCQIFTVTLCKTASECGDAGTCTEYTCGKQKVSACSKPAGCN